MRGGAPRACPIPCAETHELDVLDAGIEVACRAHSHEQRAVGMPALQPLVTAVRQHECAAVHEPGGAHAPRPRALRELDRRVVGPLDRPAPQLAERLARAPHA